MVALIDISDLEEALGYEIATEDLGPTQALINRVSTFIETYTDVKFELVEDAELKLTSDYWGLIDLPEPVVEVVSVKNWRDDSNVVYWDYNGSDQLFNLYPAQTVVVTLTYGYATVPDDIFNVAIDMCVSVIAPPRASEVTTKTVGDITEKYAAYSSLAQFMDTFSKTVLDRYRTHEWNQRLGYHSPYSSNNSTDLPTM